MERRGVEYFQDRAAISTKEMEAALGKDLTPTGQEPALRGLHNFLPRAGEEPLPQYDAAPTALSPIHCRLCLGFPRDLVLSDRPCGKAEEWRSYPGPVRI